MGRYDTLYVLLSDDGRVGDKPWVVSTEDTSVTVTFAEPLAAIIYDTWNSLRVNASGWLPVGPGYPYHQLAAYDYSQSYPPQDSTWRLPNAPVDSHKRVPGVLLFEQGRTDYQDCNVLGDCIDRWILYVHRSGFYWDGARGWPAP
jgi:hypothetical protein